MDFLLATGVVGAFLILVAFVLNELKVVGRDDLSYDGLNALGALILIWYSYQIASWPFLALNLVWALVALRDVAYTLAGKAKNR